jgi:hypothetical protein
VDHWKQGPSVKKAKGRYRFRRGRFPCRGLWCFLQRGARLTCFGLDRLSRQDFSGWFRLYSDSGASAYYKHSKVLWLLLFYSGKGFGIPGLARARAVKQNDDFRLYPVKGIGLDLPPTSVLRGRDQAESTDKQTFTIPPPRILCDLSHYTVTPHALLHFHFWHFVKIPASNDSAH